MKKIYTIISLAFVSLLMITTTAFMEKSESQVKNSTDEMLANWERAKAYTKEYLDAATEKTISAPSVSSC